MEGVIREAYAAFARGDLDGYFNPCSDDWTFNVPGNSAISGTYRGKQGLYELAQKAMTISGGTFYEEVEDVLANDRRGVVVALHRFSRNGQVHEYHTVHVYEIADGKLKTCWEHPGDPIAFERAWGAAALD